MIYTIAEIAATVTDVFFLIWYVPNFVNTKFYEHLRALVVPIILLVYQLIADRLFPGFDLSAINWYTNDCFYCFGYDIFVAYL